MVTMGFRKMFDLRELRKTLELITMELSTSVDLRARKSVAKKASSDLPVAIATSSDLYCST